MTLLLTATVGCSTMNQLGIYTMTQDMRGANKVEGNCIDKARHLFNSYKAEGKTTEVLVIELEDKGHAIVRYKDKRNRWIYLDPSFGTRDYFCKGEYVFTAARYPEENGSEVVNNRW